MRRRRGAISVAAVAASAGGRGEGGVAAPLAVRRRVVVLQGKYIDRRFKGDKNLLSDYLKFYGDMYEGRLRYIWV